MTVTVPSAGRGDWLDRVAPRRVVLAILAYVVTLAAMRLSISPFLEIDEAQFVGATDLRLVYGNSHPPLYNWLVRGALELTSGDWPAAVTLVRVSLLAATHLLTFDAARRLTGVAGGIVALAASALMPQISWMAAHTLAHSILAMAGAAGVLHALVLIALRPRWLGFVWLGMAAALGTLGKWNLALLIVPLAVAVALQPALRARFAAPAAMLSPLAFAVLAGPALVAAAMQPAASTERLEKLYETGPFTFMDVPVVGLDGVLSLVLSTGASAGVVLAAIAIFGRRTAAAGAPEEVRRVLWATVAIDLSTVAVGALIFDLSVVHERYLTPLLAPVPLLAALHLSAWSGRRWFVRVGIVAFLAVLPAIAGMVAVAGHRFARPYAEVAAPVVATLPAGTVVVASTKQEFAANIMLALRQRRVAAFIEGDPAAPPAEAFVRLRESRAPWPGGDPAPPAGFCPGAVVRTEVPLDNWSGAIQGLTALVATRC